MGMNIEAILAEACDKHPDLPAYDREDQYANPFGCESARPGNYFKNAGLTDTLRKAHARGEFAETLANVAIDMIDECDDVSWPKSDMVANRHVVGTMRMLMRRWALGGLGESKAMQEYGHVPFERAAAVVEEKTGVRYDSRKDMDENGHIDFVSPDGHMVQVKTTTRSPSFSKARDYDTLVWVKPETHELVEIEE